MLDSDLVHLFGYETKLLNRQVQRNINRFPINYYFMLTDKEYEITMLAGILKSDIEVNMSIKIVNAFVEIKNISP